MSLHPQVLCPIPEETARVARAAYPKGNIYLRMTHGTDETAIQVVKHMAFVSIYAHTATFASVAHLPSFDADTSIFGHPFDQARFPLLIDWHILLFDLPGAFQGRLSQFRLFLLQGLHPAFHRLHHFPDEAQRLFSLPKLIPVAIECRFQAG